MMVKLLSQYYFWNYVFFDFYQINMKNSTFRQGFPFKQT